jgi:putative spermidine/putrescine transport system substrate-binding protein
MKRALLLVLICLIAAGLAFGTGQQGATGPGLDLQKASWNQIMAQAKKEGAVTFYAWYFPDFFTEAAAAFEKQYGVKVTIVMAPDSVTNTNKAVAEKDLATGTMDCMILGGQSVKTVMDLGLFYGPIKGIIPESDKLAPSLWVVQEGVQTKGYSAPFHRNQTGLLYDPDKVKEPLPQTFAELTAWIEAHPKQFGFCVPEKGGSGQSMMHTVIKELCGGLEKYSGDTEVVPSKVANWNLAWEWVQKHKDQITLTASNNDSYQRVNGGELLMAVAWDDGVKDFINKGQMFARAKMYIPKMGLAGGGDTMGVLKNAPHKAAALLWIAHITSKEMQLKKFEMVNAFPARTDVTIPAVMLTENDRANALAWFPAAYKAFMISEFTKNVMMK